MSCSRSYVLWLCDACGDHAEVEPGGRCEVCEEGTIQVVPVVPAADGACELDDQERAAMDELLSVMDTIQNEWGMQSNGGELASAIHVLQGFIIQHMLHRLAPDRWSGWVGR